MSAAAGVTALVLLAALLHATWNALVKVEPDRFLALGLINASTGIMGVTLVLLSPPMDSGAWWYLGPSLVFQQLYSVILVQAYRIGDLSQVYPLARGTAPPAVALLAWLLRGDALPPGKLLGVAVISVGIVSLAWSRALWQQGQWRPVALSLGNGVLIGIYTTLDALGVRAGGSPLAYGGWLFVGYGLPWLPLLWWRKRERLREWERHWTWLTLVGGGCCCGAYLLVVWALTQQAAAPVSALRETGVIFAALIGTVLLKEPFGVRRIAAAALVALGVLLLGL